MKLGTRNLESLFIYFPGAHGVRAGSLDLALSLESSLLFHVVIRSGEMSPLGLLNIETGESRGDPEEKV